MAYVMAVLCSGRRNGYTASLLAEMLEGAQSIEGVEAELVHLHQYRFGPCTSCFACVKKPGSGCILKDDMGRKGDGALYQKVSQANGLMIADPVHGWGLSAGAHLFLERLYPMLWTGGLIGLPFASASCASNQGFQKIALRDICKFSFCYGFRYVGGLGVHCTELREAYPQAREIGRQLGAAAVRDATEGRQRFANDVERYEYYLDKPFSVVEPYLDNLTNGTRTYEGSLVYKGLEGGVFETTEGRDNLAKARPHLIAALKAYEAGDIHEAVRNLEHASAYWTNATWKEFLEQNVIGAAQPKAYRPLPTSES